MSIDLKQIQTLREKTGVGVLEVKRALEKSNGDLKKAEDILRKSGATIAHKKASRATSAGSIEAYLHQGKIGVLVEINSETDFVARNPEFSAFAHEVAMQIASMNPRGTEELLAQPFIKEPGITIQDLLHRLIGKVGENIQIKRFVRYELGE